MGLDNNLVAESWGEHLIEMNIHALVKVCTFCFGSYWDFVPFRAIAFAHPLIHPRRLSC